MFWLMKYINNNFETINTEKQELNCLNFVYDSLLAFSGKLTIIFDISFIDINTFNFPYSFEDFSHLVV